MNKQMSRLLLFIGLIFSFSFCDISAKANEKASITEQSEQQISISGIVKDSSGEPLIGVSIQIKGTTNGTITDIDGKFSMTCSENDILLFSYIGFNNLEVRAGDNAFHEIVLESDSEAIDEVVVIGYGTTTKKHVIGAVDKVGEKMMKDRPVASVSQALQGMSPSLTIQQRSMNPNDNSMNINIRGISSMNNNDPLIVIDGMISNDVQER